ncbi:hypothetical protein NC652_019700 [Populus alba x Populus x berolinensis]|nr:hypothetical protein NC652_019700 [Populus alba x Populus x berolinensis]
MQHLIFSFLEYVDGLKKKKKKKKEESFEVLDDITFADKKHFRNHLASSWAMLFFSRVERPFIAMFTLLCYSTL